MSAAHGEQIRVFEEHGAQPGRSMEWWGMIFFICSEALIFANFIAAYLYLEIRSGTSWGFAGWPNSLVNTLFLLASSATMHWGCSGLRKGDMRRLMLGLAATIVLGLIFLGGQVFEYFGLIVNEHFTLGTGTKGSAFFTLTGFHGLHVTIGIIFMVVCLIRTGLGHFTPKKHFAIQAVEMYWHFVDIVWVFVFTIVYLLPLLAGGAK
ncbi:MAG TPA: heme-copper oxidase subunit III [Dictyobacter sp.]|jgi:heme/copper-type cytochrome/quinol oxidase subunit 3|nr:heme-copper oxidase subunit III [Dictyobacter sp.]